MILEERYNEYKCMTDMALERHFAPNDAPWARLWDAMRYSAAGGGKRVRAVLLLEFARLCGGTAFAALPAAMAIEMLHAYSLIHDDLPCMDNDALRRGKPTNHTVFGEWTALLAGDALQTEAFRTLLSADLSDAKLVRCARILAEAAGCGGMCGGQQLDMQRQEQALTRGQLRETEALKTGALIEAACLMGCVCGGASETQLEAAREYAKALGLAFQVRDDMLDVLSTDEELGKPVGSDEREGKTTFMTLLGQDGCVKMIEELTSAAIASLKAEFDDPEFLCSYAASLAHRNS